MPAPTAIPRSETLPPAGVLAQVLAEDFLTPGFIDPVPVRLYRPASATRLLPVVLYLHGGGFIGGGLDEAETPARFIAGSAGVAVLSVAYSLAPARPFPAAPEDAHAAALWLIANAARLGIDSRRFAVAGHDAGGNLAASFTLISRDRNTPRLSAQVLIGPMLDPSMSKQGDADELRSDLKPELCARCYLHYLPGLPQRLHPYASPLHSLRLDRLPPALIATAEHDVLRAEAEQYGAALIAAGIPTQVTRFAVSHRALSAHPALLNDAASFLRRHLHPAVTELPTP